MQWLNENSRTFLERGYLLPGETPEQRIRDITDNAEKILGIEGFSDKMFGYMEKGYISLASPIWANFGKDRGLPISCFGSYLPDDMGAILNTHAEVGIMTKMGGGTSGYFGDLRGRGDEIKDNGTSSGPVHFMQMFDTLIDVVAQGSTRRGVFAPYLDIEHPDIMEFLEIGTEGNPIQKLNHGVVVGSDWIQEMKDGDLEKRKIWARLIEVRGEIGYPYIMFRDNANKNKPEVYKDMPILASNVCSEIMLPSDEMYSFVCCLSSLNVLHYDEWKDTDLVATMTQFLDAVLTEFITKLEVYRDSEGRDDQMIFQFMERAYNFAKDHRAIGLGVLGWHSLLQSKMLAFDDDEAYRLNVQIFKHIKEKSYEESKRMAERYGEPKILEGKGRRNTTTMAVAPTTSSAFILGQVSQSIEPLFSNCYVKDTAKAKITVRNERLRTILDSYGRDSRDTWDSIRDNDGSVQHLDFLSEQERAVFRTFAEINQYAILNQAAARQMFIDQGQSLNIMVGPSTPVSEINKMYLFAEENGIKALYYQHSKNAAQEKARSLIKEIGACNSCEA